MASQATGNSECRGKLLVVESSVFLVIRGS